MKEQLQKQLDQVHQQLEETNDLSMVEILQAKSLHIKNQIWCLDKNSY